MLKVSQTKYTRYIIFFFLSCFVIPTKSYPIHLAQKREWHRSSTHWVKENNTLYVDTLQANVNDQDFIIYKKTKSDSRWRDLSIIISFNSHEASMAGLILNYKDSTDFSICRIERSNNESYIELGKWQYGYYRPYIREKMDTSLLNNKRYKLTITPNNGRTDWRPWFISIFDDKTNQILYKRGIENEIPFFGRGTIGLYTAYNKNVQFADFYVDITNQTENKLILPSVFSDGMVLQRNSKIQLWGKASQKSEVIAKINQKTYKTKSDKNGDWAITLSSMQATRSTELMVISLTDTILIKDIAIGEVWLASGQSNMGMKVWQSDIDSLARNKSFNENIRYFSQPQWLSNEPLFDNGGYWEKAKYDNTQNWSAVAYGFAQNLYDELNVPIGIIASYWGGTSVQSWFPKEELSKSSKTSSILKEYHQALSALKNNKEIEGVYYRNIPGQVHAPGYLFNGMISHFVPFKLKGVIWYQGESNANNSAQYGTLFSMLINHYRKIWKNPNLYFAFVQLPSYDGKEANSDIEDAWPHLRDEQRLVFKKEKHIGMAVTIDSGDSTDIHPYKKEIIAKRLSYLALSDVYKINKTARTGPMYKSMKIKNDTIYITFSETANGLQTIRTEPIEGFIISGNQKEFKKGTAYVLNKNMVKVFSSEVKNPVAIRYLWENYPIDINLYNSAGLPASPFRTDSWKLKDEERNK